MNQKGSPPTLCWDCSKATGGCAWSEDFKPVKGWEVVPTKKQNYYGIMHSLIVLSCPEFDRDAYNAGLKRIGDGSIYDTVSKNT